jgi:NTP pyrophosphatase (non-canonical NTP hydrolase)
MQLTDAQIAAIKATAYESMVAALIKPGAAIIQGLTSSSANLLHMAVGVSGEAGELLDAIKKHVIYGKPLDVANVIEELGDLEFYMEGLRAELGIFREETLAANKMKLLGKRYASGTYSDDQAINRADKVDA